MTFLMILKDTGEKDMAIKKWECGTEYCDGLKDVECFEEILLDFEIEQGLCSRCQNKKNIQIQFHIQKYFGEIKDDDACEAE